MNKNLADKQHILIIDDEQTNLIVLSSILSGQGYKVSTADNGKKALDSVKQDKPDLILLDIKMPGMDGYEVCEKLKADKVNNHIPIIFLSGLTAVSDKIKAFSAGGIDYITKPFHKDEIIARVKTHVTQKKTEESLQDSNEKLKSRVNELSLLNNISKTMTKINNLKQALALTIRRIGELFNAHGGSFILFDDSKNEIEIAAHFALDNKGPDLTGLVMPNIPAVSNIIEKGESLVFSDARSAPLLAPVKDIIKARNIHAMMAVPLQIPGKSLGAIILSSGYPDRVFSSDEVKIVETIAGQVAGAIENSRLYYKAQQASQAKSEFLARMSHELRTPMNAIVGFSHLMQQTGLDSKQKDFIKKIDVSAKSLQRLINNILDFSNIDTGKTKLESVLFNLEDILKNLSRFFRSEIGKKNIDVLFTCGNDIPQFVMGDPARLEQILVGLGENAVKYTESGQISIALSSVDLISNKIKFIFSITDTGTGINQDKIPNVFDIFNQADNPLTRKFGGTGLGLAFCKRLIEMMGGEISVKSEPGHGTVFTLSLIFKYGEDTRIISSDAFHKLNVSKNNHENLPKSDNCNSSKDRSFDLSKVKPLLIKFAQLLDENDMEAVEYLGYLKELMLCNDLADELEIIGDYIDLYEFEQAFERLKNILQKLNISLSPGTGR